VPDNFLGLPAEKSDYASARFVVLPVPYEATTSFGSGTRDGPRAIIAASQQVELYDAELGRAVPAGGVATLPALEPDSRGPHLMHERVYQTARRIVRDNKFLIAIGGEHSITSGLVRAVLQRYRRLSVLQIDAHADLRNRYQGSPFSHACVMRRIHELGVPFVAVGVRSCSPEESRYIKTARVPMFSARTCHQQSDWIDLAVARLSEQVYISIDIDGFDPALAPGTGTPEPGGLNWFQVVDLLAAVAARRTIIAADVVEVRPVPGCAVTEFLAARLIHRLIGLLEG